MPHTPGQPDLPGAQEEASNLQQHLDSGVHILTGPQATRAAVTENLPAARWAHFACHGTASPDSPSESCLHLADQQLTVTDIARLHLQHADLAYLSACSTAQPAEHLADEAIHLASAFHLAGYQHVIGTLWPVSDRAAVRAASQLYAALTRTPGPLGTARALHEVTRSQRHRYPTSPTTWASHIHIGP
jgi:CHAT domain-containing protein